jgi:hypothetical protein
MSSLGVPPRLAVEGAQGAPRDRLGEARRAVSSATVKRENALSPGGGPR